MIRFTTTIKQFDEQGEKTGWTYIEIPAELAQELLPGNRKSFRVKGKLDSYPIRQANLLPMGGGNFILALKAEIRKQIGKKKGAMLDVQLEVDTYEQKIPKWITDCLKDEPDADVYFKSLPKGHQNYFIKWIESAKTDHTRTKRMAMAINALARGWGFSEMIRANKKNQDL